MNDEGTSFIQQKSHLFQRFVLLLAGASLLHTLLRYFVPLPHGLPLPAGVLFWVRCGLTAVATLITFYLLHKDRYHVALHFFLISFELYLFILFALNPQEIALSYLLLIPVIVLVMLDNLKSSIVYAITIFALVILLAIQSPEITFITAAIYLLISSTITFAVWITADWLHKKIRLLQMRSSQLQDSVAISQIISTQLDLDIILHDAVHLIENLFGFNHVSIFLLDEHSAYLTLKETLTNSPGKILKEQNYRLPLDHNAIVCWVAREQKPHISLDVTIDPFYDHQPVLPATRSEAAIPLIARGQVLGVLDVQEFSPRTFPAEDMSILQMIANQVAINIDNARLFLQTQTQLQEMKNLVNQIQTASGVATATTSILDLNTLLPTTVDLIKERFDLYYVGIYLIDENRQKAVLRAGTGQTGQAQLANNWALPLKYTSLVGHVALSGEPQIVQDARTNTLRLVNPYLPDTRAEAVLPLNVGGQTIGAVTIQSLQENVFKPDLVETLQTMVDQVAIAITNARLLMQTRAQATQQGILNEVSTQLHQMNDLNEIVQHGVQVLADYLDVADIHFVADEQTLYGRFPEIAQLITPTSQPIAPPTHQFPLTIRDQIIGHISLTLTTPLDDLKHQFIQALTREMSNALNDVYHLQTIRTYSNQLDLAVEVSRAATTILDHDTLIHRVVKLIQTRFNYYYVSLYLVNEDDQTATLHAGTGVAGETMVKTGHTLPLTSETLVGAAIINDMPQTIPAINQSPSLRPHILLPHTRTELAIPLRTRRHVIGALTIHSTTKGVFSQETIKVLQSLCEQLAIAIINARLFARLQDSNIQLRQLDTLKTQFLANMSHELRTPLNSIIGFSRVMLKGIDGPLNPAQEQDLTAIYHDGQHLLHLINEILDMAKIEAGKMNLSIERVNVGDIARAAINMARGLIDPDKVNLSWDIPTDIPFIEADPVRLKQILINLLSNAIKFTNRGHIQLAIKAEGSNVHITITDTGIGIAQEDFSKLFSAFEQVDSVQTRATGGTGLGLPITKWLVNQHNGQIWFESELNQGSVFHVLLPKLQSANQ